LDRGRSAVTLILDASAALAWIFERADNTEAEQAKAVLRDLKRRPVFVPVLWHVEVLNALVVAHRRGVVTLSKATDFLAKLDRLPIQTDEIAVPSRKDAIFALAGQYGLTAYDATYLELALRTGAALVTFDKKLTQARSAAGIPTY
jgi:predicted nucleic acid-binding protein